MAVNQAPIMHQVWLRTAHRKSNFYTWVNYHQILIKITLFPKNLLPNGIPFDVLVELFTLIWHTEGNSVWCVKSTGKGLLQSKFGGNLPRHGS